jgi:hypothetical protein
MIQVMILDQGKPVLPRNLTSLAQLKAAAEQSRNLAGECERLMQAKPPQGSDPKQGSGGTPYLS